MTAERDALWAVIEARDETIARYEAAYPGLLEKQRVLEALAAEVNECERIIDELKATTSEREKLIEELHVDGKRREQSMKEL